MTSIIIPAYNEESVIRGTLQSLMSQDFHGPLEIIVCCNGCKDNTAEVASRFSGVRVLETSNAGKPLALNMGDSAATSFPRIFLDADIEVSATFVRDITNALADNTICVAWPNVRFDDTLASSSVKAFYKVWTAMPYNTPGRIGVGAYALSERGRSKFTDFPSVIADDGYIRGLFPDSKDRLVVDTCYTRVKIPADLTSLIAIKTRSRMGVMELNERFPEVIKCHKSGKSMERGSAFVAMARNLGRFWCVAIYLYVNLLTRLRASRRLKRRNFEWERDSTTRIANQ